MEQKSLFDAMDSKTSFYIGFATAILVLGTIGFIALGSCMLNGGCDFGTPSDTDGYVTTGDTDEPTDVQPADTTATTIPIVNADDHIRGDENAPITIIEYSDFECPYCSNFHETMLEVMENYDGQVRWVYRHFPLGFHANAIPAAIASECAAEQGEFWDYADALVENMSSLNEATYLTIASDLGLNTSDFTSCIDSNRHEETVNNQYQGGATGGVTGTPGSFIIDEEGNATPIKGALPFSTVSSMIDTALE